MIAIVRWKTWVAAAIGVSAIAAVWLSVRQHGLGPLVRAAGAMPYRTVAARLSGGFAHRPLGGVHRGDDPSAGEMLPLTTAASRVIRAAHADSTALHDAGIAHLVSGETERAVIALEDALRRETGSRDLSRAIQQSADAVTLCDLAAAYIERANGTDSTDLLAATNVVARAWELAKTAEIAWNRALVFSEIGAHDAALAAWREYLSIDRESAWVPEAHARMNAIAASRPEPRDSAKAALLAAIGDSANDDAILRAVDRSSGIARVVVEEELLPAWGAGDADALDKARRMASAVAKVSGDFVASDTVARIIALDPKQSARAREALVAFGEARKAQADYRYDEALPLLESSAIAMESLGLPLAARARVLIATLYIYKKDADRALSLCAEVVARTDVSRYPSVIAQCSWNDGTIETSRRRFDRAKAAFEAARASFARMHDGRSVAALEVRLEENDRWTGDVPNAWARLVRALRLGAGERGYIPMSEAAKIADGAGMPFAALAFQRAALDVARAANERTDAQLSRAQVLWRLGRTGDAYAAINAASRSMRAIKDRTAAARLQSDLAIARSSIMLARRPDDAVAQLDAAIADLDASGNRRRIARARVLQAKAHMLRHDRAAAERSLDAALAEIESQRTLISTDEERLSLIDTTRDATELRVSLSFDAGDANAALAAVERSKARLLLDAIDPNADAPQNEIATPNIDEAFVEYFVLPDRVLVWTITANRTHAYAVKIDRGAVEKLVDEFQSALMADEDSRVRDLGRQLFDALLRDAWPDVKRCKRLVVAPDAALHRVPFAALRIDGAFVVDAIEVANVPSFTWLAAQRRTPDASGFSRVLAAVPRTGGGSFTRLAAAEQDALRIASQFPGAEVLTGEDVTETRVAASIVDADLFHFSGHAVMDERRAGRSALVLSNNQPLRASAIAQWPLHTRVVVLAACSTGAGRVTNDGTASLARAFLLAGARSAVATLWPVADKQSSAVTSHFYAVLASGRNAREALRAAQKAALNDPRQRAHYDWAAFQFIGS